MSSLADREKKLLLEIARGAVVAAVERRDLPTHFSSNGTLLQPGGAFVTLHKRSKLRGCIGQLPGPDPLVKVVAHCAASAALQDPRFSPVRADELSGIVIEISVLSTLESITVEGIVPGKHGLVVSRGLSRGVLLPQVATQFNWNSERFLEETCEKAGIKRDAWKDPETQIQAFTADVFTEAELKLHSSAEDAQSL
jgi:uncharacterized protein